MSAPFGHTTVPNSSSSLTLPEVAGIRERLEDAAPAPARKIDFALGAVLEPEAQAVVSGDVDLSDVNELSHVVMLRERRNPLEGLTG